jgi:aryl-alcohol dehydrogenase-like predicted oxidoreductase
MAPLRDLVFPLTSTIFTESTQVRLHYCNLVIQTLISRVETPLEESIAALDEIRKQGKTKYIGVSECSAQTLRKANASRLSNPLIL